MKTAMKTSFLRNLIGSSVIATSLIALPMTLPGTAQTGTTGATSTTTTTTVQPTTVETENDFDWGWLGLLGLLGLAGLIPRKEPTRYVAPVGTTTTSTTTTTERDPDSIRSDYR